MRLLLCLCACCISQYHRAAADVSRAHLPSSVAGKRAVAAAQLQLKNWGTRAAYALLIACMKAHHCKGCLFARVGALSHSEPMLPRIFKDLLQALPVQIVEAPVEVLVQGVRGLSPDWEPVATVAARVSSRTVIELDQRVLHAAFMSSGNQGTVLHCCLDVSGLVYTTEWQQLGKLRRYHGRSAKRSILPALTLPADCCQLLLFTYAAPQWLGKRALPHLDCQSSLQTAAPSTRYHRASHAHLQVLHACIHHTEAATGVLHHVWQAVAVRLPSMRPRDHAVQPHHSHAHVIVQLLCISSSAGQTNASPDCQYLMTKTAAQQVMHNAIPCLVMLQDAAVLGASSCAKTVRTRCG